MRDAPRVGSELCSLDLDWLRDSESSAVLVRQPFRNCNGDPTEGGQPTHHGDRRCSKKADGPKPPLPFNSADLVRLIHILEPLGSSNGLALDLGSP